MLFYNIRIFSLILLISLIPTFVFSMEVRDIKKSVVLIKTKDSTGSGVIISKDGLIVTSYHVLVNEGKIKKAVVKYDGKTYDYNLIGFLPNADLLVIKICPKEEIKNFAKIAELADYNIGDTVFAIGNPLGQRGFVTKGIISNFKSIDKYIYLGTDALVNPGNSGGGLFLENGSLVGIVSHVLIKGQHMTGIGFATSSVYLKKYLKKK